MWVVFVGECMVEFFGVGQGLWCQVFVGDMFNIVWYLCVLMFVVVQVDYLICVGCDGILQVMMDFIVGVGIGIDCIMCYLICVLGFYMIDLKDGECSFIYWCDVLVVCCLVDDVDYLVCCFLGVDLIYFLGIMLVILLLDCCEVLLVVLKVVDVWVVFDSNMWLCLWFGQVEMCDWIVWVVIVVDIVLFSFEEEGQFFGDVILCVIVQCYLNVGMIEVLVKNGGDDMLGYLDGGWLDLFCGVWVQLVDMIGVGDSFNGGYLLVCLVGLDMVVVVVCGYVMVVCVVM